MGKPGKRYKINNINLYVYLPNLGDKNLTLFQFAAVHSCHLNLIDVKKYVTQVQTAFETVILNIVP
ncbi:MAG: hypothetical protein AAGU10_16035 [Methanosarcina mazei]